MPYNLQHAILDIPQLAPKGRVNHANEGALLLTIILSWPIYFPSKCNVNATLMSSFPPYWVRGALTVFPLL
jgi:hypothetical protein